MQKSYIRGAADIKRYENIQIMLKYMRRAVDDFDMLREGEPVAACVSGGKDSMTMLCTLEALSHFHPKHFSVKALCIDAGFENADFSPVVNLCNELEVPLKIVKTDIKQVVFDLRKEKCPCSLCSRMRHGALHTAAKEMGCTTVALGHHLDDVIETFFINLINGGHIGCFKAKTFLDREGVTVIRPLIYTPEYLIKSFVRREGIETCGKVCPEDGNTERERFKKLIASLSENDRGLKDRIFGAIKRAGLLEQEMPCGESLKTDRDKAADPSPVSEKDGKNHEST